MFGTKFVIQKIKPLFPFNDIREYPKTFTEELNYQSNKILLFVSIVLIFVWIPYIPVDIQLHPEEPSIVILRIGLSILGVISLILYLAKKNLQNSMLILTIIGTYLELATGLITALTKGDSVYIGGYLFVLCLLAVIPISARNALLILVSSVLLFFITGFLKGMSFVNSTALYSLRDLITTSFVTAFFILLLNKMRYKNWVNTRKIYDQREELKYYKEIINNISVGICRLSMEGNLESANPAFFNMFGITNSKNLKHINISNFISDPSDWQNILSQLISEKHVNRIDLSLIKSDGSKWWGNFSANIFNSTQEENIYIDIIILDITDAKIAEEELKASDAALHASEESYRLLVENSHDIIYTLTMLGKFTFVSSSWTRLLGHSIDDVIGKPFQTFVHPDNVGSCKKYFYEVIHSKNPVYGVEYKILHIDGSWRWHKSSGVALHDKDGKVIGFEGVSNDITERKKLEDQRNEAIIALSRSEEKFRKIVDTLPQFISIWDMDMKCNYVSPSVYHLTGYTPDERISLRREEILSPEYIDQIDERLKQALIQDSGPDRDINLVLTLEQEEICKDGSKIMLQTTYTFLRDENGTPVNILALSADITERKRSEQVIKESEQRLADIINFLPLATIVIDSNGKVTAWNQSMEELTGIKSNSMIGKGNYEYSLPFYGERRPILVDFVFKPNKEVSGYDLDILNEGGMLNSESFIPLLGKNGIYIEGYATALYDSGGNIIGAIESIRDITKIKQTEQDLKDAKEAAEAANQSKSAFLANMSHEIRTPMNAILGFAEIISSKLKSPELVNYTKIIISSGNALLAIINDILDLSKIEAGKLELQPAYINMSKILQEINKLFIQKANEKGLEIINEISEEFPKSVFLDEIRIIQVLMNLVGNAIKFTDKGYVKIRVDTKPYSSQKLESKNNKADRKNKSDIFITIEDTGIGIQKEQIENIFKPFEQAEGQNSRRFGGTGLGLSISTKLIQMMGGKISVESEIGKGSKFIISIPDINLSDETINGNQLGDFSEMEIEFYTSKILVVDDLQINRDLVKAYLEEYNLIISETQDGETALREVIKNKYDLILLDRKMPGMDGEQVAKILKNEEKTKDIPIVMFTASALKEEEERIKSIVDSILTKPVNKLRLVQELKKYLPFKEKTKARVLEEIDTPIVSDKELSVEEKKEFIFILEEILYKEWETVSKTRAMGNVRNFAINLHKTADKYGNRDLLKYSNELLESVNLFKVAKVKVLLNDFIVLLNKVKS